MNVRYVQVLAKRVDALLLKPIAAKESSLYFTVMSGVRSDFSARGSGDRPQERSLQVFPCNFNAEFLFYLEHPLQIAASLSLWFLPYGNYSHCQKGETNVLLSSFNVSVAKISVCSH